MYDKNQSILPSGLIIINKKNLYFKIKVDLYFKIKVEVLFLAKDCFFDKIGAIVRLEKQAA